MRVLYLTNESHLTGPIIESQVINLLERLMGRGVTAATLLTFDPVNEAETREYGTGIRHVLFPDRGHVRNMLAAGRFLLRHRATYDLLHVRSYPAMVPALPGRWFLGKRLLFDPRGAFPEELSYFGGRRLLTALFAALERVFCRASDATVVVSEPFRAHLIRRHRLAPDRVITIPTFSSPYEDAGGRDAVPDIRRELGWGEATRIYVYSGSMEGWQRLDDVVRFVRLGLARDPGARFLVLSKQREQFERYLSSRLGPGTYAVMSAFSKALAAHLEQCDFGVLFRDDHLVNRVAAPIKVKDYLIAGLPVVLTDGIGDSSAWVHGNGCGVVLADLTDASMRRALDRVDERSPWDHARIAAVARAAFDVAPVAEAYRRLYQRLAMP